MGRGKRHRLLWIPAALLLAVLLFKFFIGDVYPVSSGSMRPAIFGGYSRPGEEVFTEYLFVRFTRDTVPDRYDLVVLDLDGEDDPLVKRALGLPPEKVQVVGGDLLVDDHLLAPGPSRPELIPLFDDRYLEVERYFEVTETVWTRDGSEWQLDATDVRRGSNGGMLFYHLDLRDGYLDQNHALVPGVRQVNDGAVECEVMLAEAKGAVRLLLTEEGDTFEARIESPEVEGDPFLLTVTRHNEKTLMRSGLENKRDVLIAEEIPFATGRWHRAHFANLDNHIVFELDAGEESERFRRVAPYDANHPHGRQGIDEASLIPRAALGGEGSVARFRAIRILRDIYYTERGEEGVRTPLHLGPGEYFVLGDNSGFSADSRTFGPVTANEIVGFPVAVVWPWERRRRL